MLGAMAGTIDTRRLRETRETRAQRRARTVVTTADSAPGDDAVVVILSDDTLLDTLGELRWRLGGLLESGPSRLVLDLSRVSRLSSTTVGVLLWVRRGCRARGVEVVVRRPTRGSIRVLHRTGLIYDGNAGT